ncbi:hypothetical protein EJ04DRAFT_29375 [Polyplosphaeria fusca]|uniref:Uncharacterized protein n=1 Tax=Polyplosphaeria fusca TaxID=682080 RepID=A0A9P4QTK0_9PLEO|nr:hypothetical protein EJ04DRAFT_29375 [Polyplosphaeria fusca]
MCRIEERVYITPDGTRRQFEESYPCHKSRHGKLCKDAKRKVTEYYSPPPARDSNSSPASYNPPTPTGNGTYLVQKRQPAGVSRQPSTSRGTGKTIEPKIIIEFGSKKDKGKKYPSSKGYKRSSYAGSIGSNEIAIESPGSDASFTVRTGYPENAASSAEPLHPTAYNTRPAVPLGHRRDTSSASSSQVPSLYATSDPESPGHRRVPRYPPTIVHNPPPGAIPPPSPTATRNAAVGGSYGYRTTTHVPSGSSSGENVGIDGVFPNNYSDLLNSNGRSAAPEITDRDADRARLRKQKADAEKKRQEEADEQLARELANDEARHVHFETGRADARAEARAQKSHAEQQKRRDEQAAKDAKKSRAERDRLQEEIDRRQRQVDEAEAKVRSERRDSRPPVRDPSKRHSRRHSVTPQEKALLLQETQAIMAQEREAAEQREREERAAELRQKQSTSQYWDPRRNQYPVSNEAPSIGRRGSLSQRRPSISSANAPPTGLGRTSSQRRVSVIQQNPPPISTAFQPTDYRTRPGSSHAQNPFSATAQYQRPPSARASNSSYENPFAQPQLRQSPPVATRDPWDARDMKEAIPQPTGHRHQTSEDRTIRRRGENVIAASQDRARQHDRARQATRNMEKAVGFEGDYQSDSENEEDRIFGQGPRLGLGPRRKH